MGPSPGTARSALRLLIGAALAACGTAPTPTPTHAAQVGPAPAAAPMVGTSTPEPPPREERLPRPTEVRITTCRSLSLARLASRDVFVWGALDALSDTPRAAAPRPTRVTGLEDAVDLACDLDRLCALLVDGSVACADRASARIAVGDDAIDLAAALAPLALPAPARAIAMSPGRLCAVLDDGRVACDGAGPRSVMGPGVPPCADDADASCTVSPVEIEGLSSTTALALGESTSCALDDSGRVRCWGMSSSHVLGTSAVDRSETPLAVDGLPPAQELVVGSDFACARDEGGVVRCWGGGSRAETDAGRAADASLRLEVPALTGARGLVAHWTSVCGVVDERPVCATRPVPPPPRTRHRPRIEAIGVERIAGAIDLDATELAAAPPTRALALGYDHACVVASDGAVWCWGRNWDGAVGDAWAEARSQPTLVLGATGETSADPLPGPALDEPVRGEDTWYDFDDVSLATLDPAARPRATHPRELVRASVEHAAATLRACEGADSTGRVVIELRLAPPDTRVATGVRVAESAEADAVRARCFAQALERARWPMLLGATRVRVPLVP